MIGRSRPVRAESLAHWIWAVPLGVAACTSSSPDQAALSDVDVSAIRQAQQSFVRAELAGNWIEAAKVFSERAVRMQPNEPWLEGRAAI